MPEWSFEEPNPIQHCSIAVWFVAPVPPATIREIAAMHGQFKRDLPRKVEQQALTLQLNMSPGQVPTAPVPELGGIVFDYINPTGLSARALTVAQNSVTYSTQTYTRWAEFWPLADRLISTTAAHIAKTNPVAAFVLEFHDRFQWNGEPDAMDFKLLLRADSPYIPANFLSQHGLAHSTHGWLSRDEAASTVRIDNVNVIVADQPSDGRGCTVAISHRLHFDTPLLLSEELFQNSEQTKSLFGKSANAMHVLNKQLLRASLADYMIERIPGLRED
jgi:uncharacterized protein (TIGR04255 family)